MKKDDLVYVGHIYDSVQAILRFTAGRSFEEFSSDEMMREAVFRKLEIIGEATKRISVEFRVQHDDLPWKKMAGMRDKLIHDYMGIRFATVWSAIRENIPELEMKLQKLIKSE